MSDHVDIQLQQVATKNWSTMKRVINEPLYILRAMEELKRQYPTQRVRATLGGRLVDILM